MRRLPIVFGALAALTTAAFAAEDPIATRKALMDNNGGAAALAGAVLKDEVAYSPVVGKAVILAFRATASAIGDFFPEGSADPANSAASPKIWEDAAGFQAQLAKFGTNVAAAAEVSGKDGPADKAAFAAAVTPIFDNCKSCHEAYRVKN